MVKKINITEAASVLAEERVKQEFKNSNKGKTDEEIEKLIYREENETLVFTENAQDMFNDYYDMVQDILLKCETND